MVYKDILFYGSLTIVSWVMSSCIIVCLWVGYVILWIFSLCSTWAVLYYLESNKEKKWV